MTSKTVDCLRHHLNGLSAWLTETIHLDESSLPTYREPSHSPKHHDPWTEEQFPTKERSTSLNDPLSIRDRTVQVWLGHESLATTQKYLEPSKETGKQLDRMKLPF